MGDKNCEQCHYTCVNGCSNGDACTDYACHADCATCSGPGANQCTSCHCNATLDDGCCACDAGHGYLGSAHNCQLATCEDQGCDICITNDNEHSCVMCKDNFEYIQSDDEGFGYCEYCYDDDFYPYPTCGGRQRDQVVINYSDEHFESHCECDDDHHLVDGHCTTCGQNCSNCDMNRCTECEFGFWFDDTETVCIDFCPTGTVYDAAANSGSCVTDAYQSDILDFTFDCVTPITDTTDEVIQRFFARDSSPYDIDDEGRGSPAACYSYELYGGANAKSIEQDDPTPIPDRGYWFNGECKFLTLEGYVPGLTLTYTAWLKPHKYQGALYNYSAVVEANHVQPSYNVLYTGEEYVCWDSSHG